MNFSGSVRKAYSKAKCWIFERDEEDEQKTLRRSHSYVEGFFVKSDEVAAKKPALEPKRLCEQTLRPTFAEINLQSLAGNFRLVQSLITPKTGVMAMIKADAYGHGVLKVASKLAECGVTAFGVATVEEGVELRESGIEKPIVVMGGLMGMGEKAAAAMIEAHLTPVVHSFEVLELLELAAKKTGRKVKVHIKVDTGMSRLGALPAGLTKLLQGLKEFSSLHLEGVMTHLASADDEDYTRYQMTLFEEVLRQIGHEFGPVEIAHASNSAAIIDGRYRGLNNTATWVRPGIMLYGSYPAPQYQKKATLEPVMSLKSAIILLKRIPKGTKVSYGCTFTAQRETRVAVVPMGYADGYPWALSNKGFVLVGGRRAPVIGLVTMDMIIVDVTDLPVPVGSEVVLMGRQGEEVISVEELARLAGTIPYEIFCGISKRMPRVYVENESHPRESGDPE